MTHIRTIHKVHLQRDAQVKIAHPFHDVLSVNGLGLARARIVFLRVLLDGGLIPKACIHQNVVLGCVQLAEEDRVI